GNNGYITFPGSGNIENLITVGASDRNNNQANYSPDGIGLEISAPSHTAYNTQITGESYNIWTIDIPGSNYGYNSWRDYAGGLPTNGEILPNYGTNYADYTGRMGGTSAATAEVAGVAALVKSVNPCLTNQEIKEILEESADKIGGFNYNWSSSMPGHSKELGYGKVNAYAAVQMAQQMGSMDLMIKDSPEDIGSEPNTESPNTWSSKDIWVRNDPDNGTTHQDPDYDQNPNYVYVRVTNTGCIASSGTEELEVYWTKANTYSPWREGWDGTIEIDRIPLGGYTGTVTIPVVQP